MLAAARHRAGHCCSSSWHSRDPYPHQHLPWRLREAGTWVLSCHQHPERGPGAELRGLALINAGFGFRLLSPDPALRWSCGAALRQRAAGTEPSRLLLISPYFPLFLQFSSSSKQALSLRLRGRLVPALSQGHWGGSWPFPAPPGHLQRGRRARAARGQAPPAPPPPPLGGQGGAAKAQGSGAARGPPGPEPGSARRGGSGKAFGGSKPAWFWFVWRCFDLFHLVSLNFISFYFIAFLFFSFFLIFFSSP